MPSRNEQDPSARRRFLKKLSALAAVPAVGGPAPWLLGCDAADATRPPAPPVDGPARVRGRVETSGGQGLAGVGVTDGRTYAATGADGAFELEAAAGQPFVYLSLPAGYRIPQSATGTARFYQPLRAGAGETMEASFQLEPLQQPGERHAFLALADPQTQNAYEMERFHTETVPDVRQTARALGEQPLFGVTIGDILFDDLSLFPDYERAVEKTGLPFFQVVGNHDLDRTAPADEGSAQTFRRYFGPTYYSFDRGAVHYVVLDNVYWTGDGYRGYLPPAQLAWLEADLARVEEGRPVVVFQHIPASTTQHRRRGNEAPGTGKTTSNREALYELLGPYQAHILSGHLHESEHVYAGGTHEHAMGTVCAAWWSGPIAGDGSPLGYSVYEVDGEDLRWRYKATGHDADYQLRVYEAGADAERPGEVVANVWDWNPDWTVVWYEDGVRRGQMTQRLALDPLSVKLHAGEDKPQRRPWVEPIPTEHLFYAAAAPGAGRIRVEATDGFGRTYSAAPEAL